MPLLVGISVVTFAINALAPGDPITAMMDPEEVRVIPVEELERRREALGLNDPIPVRYALWGREVVQGNLGYSFHFSRPVTEMILDRILPSLALVLPSTLLGTTLGVALGVASAMRRHSGLDHALTFFAFLGMSMPGFFLAILAIYVFGVQLRWFPIFGMWTPGQPTGVNLDLVRHAVLPVAVLTLLQAPTYMRYARASMVETLSAEYVTVARAKGLRERIVISRHALRNATLPLVTLAGLELPSLVAGSVFVETIFSWPGIGQLGYEAVVRRDYPLQMGIALVGAVAVLLSSLVTDIVYTLVDPRIRYG